MATPQPQFRIGGYEMIRLLGRGGMGEVWLAIDTRADRQVAVKFVKPGLLDDPAIRTRFLNEARTLGRLEQDRIVTLYNVVEDGSVLALVLRFIDGTSLAERIDAQGALPLDFVAASARDILPALGFAHANSIIHRDIKPQNVLVDRLSRSFLTDFGIAVGDFAERGTVTGFAVGTPHYMSPEQIQTPRAIDHRSDIYSYGVVLYEMLTGRVPFGAESGTEEIYAVQRAHCMETPPPLHDVNPLVPLALEKLVLRCLEKKPEDRPQSCADLLSEFDAAIDQKAAVAPIRRSPGYVATIVEKPRTAEPASSPKRPAVQPAAPAAATQAKRGIPKMAWLAMGGVLIAGGVSYAVLSSSKAPVAKTDPTPTKQEQPKTTPPPTQPQMITGPPKPAIKGTENTPKTDTPKITPSPPIPAGPTPQQIKAEAASKLANTLLLQRKYCDGKSKIDEAIGLDPQPAYVQLQNRLGSSCTAEGLFKEAQGLYAQGQGGYCQAVTKMDEVIKLNPTDSEYLEFRKKAVRGCNQYGQ